MGILNRGMITDKFNNGLYKRTYCNYSNLYIDGELVRFKGMTDQNKTQRNAEEAIARDGVKYLRNRVNLLESYFGKTFDGIFVYMDGKRVHNKETRVYDTDVDIGLIRSTFKDACEREHYRIVQLTSGEGELQMYLQRDKSSNRNVFLTKDSDMLSILYGHTPNYRNEVSIVPKTCSSSDAYSNIIDLNDDYDKNVEVYDSCVWVECDSSNTPMRVYGFDDTVGRLRFSKLVFRTFCAMCGTDFTDSLLTPGMVGGFFTCIKPEELATVNEYEIDLLDYNTDNVSKDALTKNHIFQIIILILLSGFRNRGTVKQIKKQYETGTLKNLTDLKNDLYNIVRVYYVYITLGVMLPIDIPRLKTVAHNYIKTIVHVCRDGASANYTKPTVALTLYNWATTTNLNDCVKNYTEYENYTKFAKPKQNKIRRKLIFDEPDEETKNLSAKRFIMNLDYKLNVKKFTEQHNVTKDVILIDSLFICKKNYILCVF